MITVADKDADALLNGSPPSKSLVACSFIHLPLNPPPPQPKKKRLNKQTSHRHSSPFPQTLFITGGWVWWQEERGAGTPRQNKAALKGKGIIRFIASNKSWKSQKILIQLINPSPRRGAEKVNQGQICEAASSV